MRTYANLCEPVRTYANSSEINATCHIPTASSHPTGQFRAILIAKWQLAPGQALHGKATNSMPPAPNRLNRICIISGTQPRLHRFGWLSLRFRRWQSTLQSTCPVGGCGLSLKCSDVGWNSTSSTWRRLVDCITTYQTHWQA